VNAQPQRLDLSGRLLKAATEKGVKIVISSAALLNSHCDYMQMGILMARRGWCTKEHVLNTKHWEDIEAFKRLSLLNKLIL